MLPVSDMFRMSIASWHWKWLHTAWEFRFQCRKQTIGCDFEWILGLQKVITHLLLTGLEWLGISVNLLQCESSLHMGVRSSQLYIMREIMKPLEICGSVVRSDLIWDVLPQSYQHSNLTISCSHKNGREHIASRRPAAVNGKFMCFYRECSNCSPNKYLSSPLCNWITDARV